MFKLIKFGGIVQTDELEKIFDILNERSFPLNFVGLLNFPGAAETVAATNGDSGQRDENGLVAGGRESAEHVRELLSKFFESNGHVRSRKMPKYAIRPLSEGVERDDEDAPVPNGMCREAMILVFGYLCKKDLVSCMQVRPSTCKLA